MKNKYSTPDFELIKYINDDVLQTSEEYQEIGAYNAEGSASGWMPEDIL